ncbi:MAG: MHFG family PEP-CTERM protein [Pseudomonadota bacterium]
MSLLLALALAGAAPAPRPCSWDRPGVNPFMGDVVAAVDRYRDIPPDVRSALKARMARHDYDDIVSIRRDSITGKHRYDPALKAMHFGSGTVCNSVTRSKWTAQAEQRGLVYCEQSECLVLPTICRNLSRIKRAPGQAYPPAGFLPRRGPAPEAAAPAVTEAAPVVEGGGFVPPGGPYPAVGSAAPAPPALPSNSPPGVPRPLLPPAPPITGCADCNAPFAPPPLFPSAPPGVVPEPQSWAMLMAGLACIALMRRRRRSANVNAVFPTRDD